TLHLGHATMLAVEDILVRYHRMKGERTLWLPGTDSAAIATQSKVEGALYKKENKTRHDLGREEFLHRVEEFAAESHSTITGQIRKMGASVDWSREAYTLDAKRRVAVNTAFKAMYDDGLIERGARIVNWDPKLQTTISDVEIEWREEVTPLYYLQYGPFIIATARPETKFGDKYVVMHPDDVRYRAYTHGQKIELEWINGPVSATIIKDTAIDREFGTGIMTITPWHDATDFVIAERHKLEREQIIDLRGRLLPIAGELAGIPIKKARSLIVEKLRAKGLLVKTDETYTHRIATNSRGGGTIEPQIMSQWFIMVNRPFLPKNSRFKNIPTNKPTTLKKMMLAAVKNKQIGIIPKRFEKIYFHWTDHLQDWCISRQIWFGHRIPVWYKGGETRCSIVPPQDDGWEQDPDTLDTWFSSGLWTFSTLGWPEKTDDLKTYHPTSVLETGYDILPFWVARMILMSCYHLGDIPFHTVYLHGLVRDTQGRKMSKSLDNSIDPLEYIKKYGADATRLSLIIGAAPGNDIKLSEERVRGYRNFANKIWNATRFLLLHIPVAPKKPPRYTKAQQAMRKELAKLITDTTRDLDTFNLHRAAERLYHFFWHYYADKVIEKMKPALALTDDTPDKQTAQALLLEFHITLLTLLHPFMPFVTETAWCHLPHTREKMKKHSSPLLMVTPWSHGRS
ncbi:MAG: valine--tRNA ligase, partial [Candidatus Sungbacteria bacterium]|nr:valine--tRNA ligase [Candidatus Sungbacteria bacterium]